MEFLDFLAILERFVNLIFLPIFWLIYKCVEILLSFRIDINLLKRDIKELKLDFAKANKDRKNINSCS